jgi:hypothetical protein
LIVLSQSLTISAGEIESAIFPIGDTGNDLTVKVVGFMGEKPRGRCSNIPLLGQKSDRVCSLPFQVCFGLGQRLPSLRGYRRYDIRSSSLRLAAFADLLLNLVLRIVSASNDSSSVIFASINSVGVVSFGNDMVKVVE